MAGVQSIEGSRGPRERCHDGRAEMADETVRLITRGDDAAVAEGANDAIRDHFGDGILRNVSVMAPCPAFDHAAERLAGVDGLCVGVHVT